MFRTRLPKLPRVPRAATQQKRTTTSGAAVGTAGTSPHEGAFRSMHRMPRDHAKADWRPHIRKAAITTAFWVPAMSIWTVVPYFGRWMVNGHVSGNTKPLQLHAASLYGVILVV